MSASPYQALGRAAALGAVCGFVRNGAMADPLETSSGQDPRLSTKQLVLQAVTALPDDADFDDIIERLQFVYEVQRGLADADAGRIVPQDEARRRMATWRT